MDLATVDIDSAELARLYEAPLTLVRPDQVVAWRGADDTEAERIIATVLGHRTPGAG
ncbi:MAG: hypothetical protein M9883_21255 [Methylobacteriaceae bacterium]|nr:hypothetical protein [Methylobacteriaceae bacterium]